MNSVSTHGVSRFASLRDGRCDEAASKPRKEHVPKRVASIRTDTHDMFESSNGKTGSYSLSTPEYAAPVKPTSSLCLLLYSDLQSRSCSC